MKIQKSSKKPTMEKLQELRTEIQAAKEEGIKIISHYTKLQEYYSDWEDRLNNIENVLQEVEKETGLDKALIAEYDALDDVFSILEARP